ncbi:hypothetical protein J6590_064152 [Homalodisca vitripennis]|nr:hypothetical protein J6590_064152 [Homalodisca vitripennis]
MPRLPQPSYGPAGDPLSCQCEIKAVGDAPIISRISQPIAHGEGPHWDDTEQVLYYVDIAGQTIHRYDPNTQLEKTITFSKPVSLVVPIKDQKYKFVVTLGLDMMILTWDWDSGFNYVSPLVSVDQHSPRNRWNDGKADANGRMWAGTMGFEEPVGVVAMNTATFYRVDNNPLVPCRADLMRRPVSISNGLAWSSDSRTLYYTDTPTRRVDAYDFDLAQGNISNPRTVFEFGNTAGNPDGMTIDSDGNLWIACWGGSQVIQIDPNTGRLLRQIKLPVERVTSVVFGGPRLDTLFVTSMRAGLSPKQLRQQPLAGALWQVTNLHVTGTISNPAIVNCKCNS